MAGYLGFDATDSKPFIFISYNTEDQDRISRITKALRAYNVNIWYDNGIHRISDQEWHEQIAIHIRNAEVVFFFITRMLFEKEDSFVKKEYDLASQHAKKICVVLLDKIEARDIPPKYDFWWINICNRQCIEAAGLSDFSIADEMYKEYCRAGNIQSDALHPRHSMQTQKRESRSESVSQNNINSISLIIALMMTIILVAILGLFIYRTLFLPAPSEGPSNIDTSTTAVTIQKEDTDDPYKDVVLPQSVPDQYYFYGDHTYAFYDASRYGFTTYGQVADFCRTQGGHLAVINDADENTYLFNLLRDVSNITAFFGYSDEDNEGEWQWSDGDSSYTNWTRFGDWDLPDNGKEWGGNEDYAEFNYEKDKPGIPSDGTWNDAPFMDNTSLFICEWDYDMNKAKEYKSTHGN